MQTRSNSTILRQSSNEPKCTLLVHRLKYLIKLYALYYFVLFLIYWSYRFGCQSSPRFFSTQTFLVCQPSQITTCCYESPSRCISELYQQPLIVFGVSIIVGCYRWTFVIANCDIKNKPVTQPSLADSRSESIHKLLLNYRNSNSDHFNQV